MSSPFGDLHDFRRGTLDSVAGDRMVFLPADLLAEVVESLRYEAGEAWREVLYRVGQTWGADVHAALAESQGTDASLEDVLGGLRSWLQSSGLGDLTFDLRDAESIGVVWVSLHFGLYRELLSTDEFTDPIVCGVVEAFFAETSSHDLMAMELRRGMASEVVFAVSGRERLARFAEAVDNGATQEQLRGRLLE